MPKQTKKLICIGGPTASGKTDIGISLAQKLDTSIISADSRQIYKYFDIGTAKPTSEELNKAPHFLIDILEPEEKFSAGDFEREALRILDTIFAEKDYAIVVGGTGLFFNALIYGLDEFPDVPEEIRNDLNTSFQKKGIGYLQDTLQKLDPYYYKTVDIHNPNRLIRAISVSLAANVPYSSFLNQKKAERPFESFCYALNPDRDQLYEKINLRVDNMIEKGLQEEVESLLKYKGCDAFNTVGYKEWLNFFDGTQSLDRTIELIRQNSRRYAKRQFTWFRNQGNWLPVTKNLLTPKKHLQIGIEENYILSLIK